MYSELPGFVLFGFYSRKKQLKNRLASPPSTLVQTLTDSVHFFYQMSIVSDECIYLFWSLTLGETTCLQGLSLFCYIVRWEVNKGIVHFFFKTCEDVDMRNVFLHEVSIIKDVSTITFFFFITLISLKACMCSGSCVFCRGHSKAVLSIVNVLCLCASDAGRDPLELCQRHSRLRFLYWKLPCCRSPWFKAVCWFPFLHYSQQSQRSPAFSVTNLITVRSRISF